MDGSYKDIDEFTMILAAGNLYYGAEPAELFSGGEGSDTVSYQNSASPVVVSLSDPSINTGDAAGDAYQLIENLSGTDFDDIIVGDAQPNVLYGLRGSDTIRALDGDGRSQRNRTGQQCSAPAHTHPPDRS